MAVVPQPVDGGLDVPVLDIVFIDGLALEIVDISDTNIDQVWEF